MGSGEQIPAAAGTINKIDIKTIDGTQAASTPKEEQERDSRLQKRDWLTDLASWPVINNNGVSNGHGNGAIIIGGKVVGSGGASNVRSVSYSGNHLEFDSGRVHVTVHSPGRSQRIAIRGKRAFVNRKLVSKNVDNLEEKPKYQKSADGALWYTNLPVGKEMTDKEIEEFNEKAEEVKERVRKAEEHTAEVLREADRVREEALRGAERARAAAMEQAARAMDMANSFWGWNWGW